MQKINYRMAGMAVICLAFALKGIAQDDPEPPASAIPPAETITGTITGPKDNKPEIIIRQKGDKDSKVTIEIRNGDFYVNGKPLQKFEDKNLEIEKREPGMDGLSYSISPFRGNDWNQQRAEWDLQRKMNEDMLRSLGDRYRHESNEAFLGVASRKTETGGATILEVTGSSPADKAGLKKGDVITGVNDEKIESPEKLFETIHRYKPGEKVNITFKRDGKEQSVTAVLEKSKQEPRVYNFGYSMPDMPDLPGLESPVWGPMPPKIGIKAQDSEEGKGVNVLEVTEGSAAEKAGLKKGDIITSFDGTEVNSANELIQVVRGSREKSSIKVKILRNGKQQDMDIKIPRKLRTAEL